MIVLPGGTRRAAACSAAGVPDDRGWFCETGNERCHHEAGIQERFVQDNLSFSRRGTLRGLHLQNPNAQGKLVMVLQGEVWYVAVDLRRSSPTFRRWQAAHTFESGIRETVGWHLGHQDWVRAVLAPRAG